MVKSKSFGARVFVVVNALVIGLLAASCLIPLIHVFAISLSDKSSASGGLVALWPVKFTLESYKYVINRAPFWTAMLVSLKRVLVGVSLNMFFCIICAYPLSKERNQFRARTVYAWYFFITMLVSGGMIPLYMVINLTGLKGTFWSLVIPGAVPVYNIILLLNFFRQTPRELEEAAIMDGARQWRMPPRRRSPPSPCTPLCITGTNGSTASSTAEVRSNILCRATCEPSSLTRSSRRWAPATGRRLPWYPTKP